MPPPLDVISGQGSTFTWGTTSFEVTSIQVSSSVDNSEIDITSMSSKVKPDPDDTKRRFITRDFDACFAPDGNSEISIDFFVEGWLSNMDVVGRKRNLVLKVPKNTSGAVGFSIESSAVLSQMQISVVTAEFVRGSATFRLSGQ